MAADAVLDFQKVLFFHQNGSILIDFRKEDKILCELLNPCIHFYRLRKTKMSAAATLEFFKNVHVY